jgi:hypothetical protein
MTLADTRDNTQVTKGKSYCYCRVILYYRLKIRIKAILYNHKKLFYERVSKRKHLKIYLKSDEIKSHGSKATDQYTNRIL